MNTNIVVEQRAMAMGNGEMVCWVALLHQLSKAQGAVKSAFPFRAVVEARHKSALDKSTLPLTQISTAPAAPCVRILRRSWDFMVRYIHSKVISLLLSDLQLK
jgi:hypothetical protein